MHTVVQQPIGNHGMTINPRNSLNKPDVDGQGRDWSTGLFACSSVGTCCLACILPCMVYGSNKERLSHLQNNGTPDPDGGSYCNSSCCLYGALAACLGIGCIMQISNRGNMRSRYGIQGGGCTDCLTSCFCSPCALVQEEQEIELEEKALAQGAYHKA